MKDEQQPQEEQRPSNETGLTSFVPPSPEQDPGAQNRGGRAYRTPSREDILEKLDHMPGLIALGLLPPAKAIAMKGVYQTMLSHLGDAPQTGAAGVADDDVIKILQQQPEMLKVLQPFLTPEQLDLIVREASK